MQTKFQADLTNGLSVAVAAPGADLSRVVGNPNAFFTLAGSGKNIDVQGVVLGGDGRWRVNLGANYAGATAAGVACVLHESFTSQGVAYPDPGDTEWPAIAKRQAQTMGTLFSGVRQVSQRVVYASMMGCACDSNIDTGGGTDDTVALQAALALLNTLGGGTLVIDGVCLISDVLVSAAHLAALLVGSNTTLSGAVPGKSGLFLKSGSNCTMVSNLNITGNPAAILDHDIALGDLILNGNDANQNKFERRNAANTWNFGLWFGGVRNLSLANVTVRNAKTYAFVLGNLPGKTRLTNPTCLWDQVDSTFQDRNRDSLHIFEGVADLVVDGFQRNAGSDDDAIAVSNEGHTIYTAPANANLFGLARFPWTNMADGSLVFRNTDLGNPPFGPGVRVYGPAGSDPLSIAYLEFRNTRGTASRVPMQTGNTSIATLVINGWYVTGYSQILLACSNYQFTDALTDPLTGKVFAFYTSNSASPQTFPGNNAFTVVSLPLTLKDFTGAFSTATNTFTAPRDGLYRIAGRFWSDTLANSGAVGIYIKVSGDNRYHWLDVDRYATAGKQSNPNGTLTLLLTAGQTLQFGVYNGTSGNITGLTDGGNNGLEYTYLCVEKTGG